MELLPCKIAGIAVDNCYICDGKSYIIHILMKELSLFRLV